MHMQFAQNCVSNTVVAENKNDKDGIIHDDVVGTKSRMSNNSIISGNVRRARISKCCQ